MTLSLIKVRVGILSILIFVAFNTTLNTPIAIEAQETQEIGDCEPQIVFSQNVYDVAPDVYLLGVLSSDQLLLTNSGNGIYVSAEQPNWSPDGKTILFTGQVSEPAGGSAYNLDIFAIAADGSRLERLTHTTSNELRPVYSPDGNKIAFATDRDGNWEVYVMNADGSDPVNLTMSEANDGDRGLAWSPDGNSIAFVTDRLKAQTIEGNYEAEQIYMIDVPTGSDNSLGQRVVNLTADVNVCPAGEFYTNIAWSHSQSMIAFALSCGFLSDVYLMDLDQPIGDQALVNLTQEEAEISTTNDGFLGLSWSPDDSQIVYVSSPEGQGNFGAELFVISVDNDNVATQIEPEQITHNNSMEIIVASPDWRPCEVEADLASE